MSRHLRLLVGGALGFMMLGTLAVSSGAIRAAGQATPPERQRLRPDMLYPDYQDFLPSLRDVTPIPPPWYADLQEKDTHEVKRWPSHRAALTRAEMKLVNDAARQP